MAELDTQPQVPPHVLPHEELVIRVPVSGHFYDVYGLHEKKSNFFNIDHILHQLDDLIV